MSALVFVAACLLATAVGSPLARQRLIRERRRSRLAAQLAEMKRQFEQMSRSIGFVLIPSVSAFARATAEAAAKFQKSMDVLRAQGGADR